jgi:hypothetical protein
MNDQKVLAQSSDWDWEVARAYMDKAVREGRTEDDGLEDYLASLGFTRTKDHEAFLQNFSEETQKSFERIEGYLGEMRKLIRAAKKKYAGV